VAPAPWLVKERILHDLEADTVEFDRDLALLSVVGIGMKHTPGIAARAATALAGAGVNIELINQGPSEISMVFGIKQEDGPTAVRALYREFCARVKT
jgi:aspartate kinase